MTTAPHCRMPAGLSGSTPMACSTRSRRTIAPRSLTIRNTARMRAVFLIVNDLGAIVLRDLVEQAIGVDPLSPAGMRQWGAVVMDVYTRGVYAQDPTQPNVTQPDATRPETDREGS